MKGSIRERLESLSRGELAGLVLVVVATFAGAALWYVRSLPRPVDIAAPSAGPANVAGGGPSAATVVSPSPTPAPIIVDVAGWVRKPGVYEFSAGDRVIDAVNEAGGAKKGADLTSLNLAAPLADGTQVVVPKAGAPTTGASGGATGGSSGVTLVNVNTATETELESLPGVGPVTAAAIIEYRTQNGPFATVDDLVDVSGIGPSTLEQMRPFVTV
ncbi:MAG: helix-hairpin-helix domain-containing protein [Actinomycetota bacterium]